MLKRNCLIYRRIAFEQYKLKRECVTCYSIINICVHHKDENYHNNAIDNLQILCRSCHTRLHKLGKPGGMLGRKHSQKSIENMRIVQLGQKNGMYGKKHSQTAKEKISIANKGNTYSLGKKISIKGRLNMSLARMGKNPWNKNRGKTIKGLGKTERMKQTGLNQRYFYKLAK